MPINKKLKVLFIHIPKNAGTSICKMLDMSTAENLAVVKTTTYADVYKRLGAQEKFSPEECNVLFKIPPQHCTLLELKKLLGELDDYFIFCVVRNPYARLVSEYNWKFNHIEVKSKSDFDDFVKYNLLTSKDARKMEFQGHLELQSSYVSDASGKLDRSVHVYKMENLTECFAKIDEIYPGVPTVKANSSLECDYREYYTPRLQNVVYNFYREDFENFGYSKDFL